MARLFRTLAILNLLALLLTFAVGAFSRFGADRTGELYLTHFLLGLFTAIGTLLVHCLIFTYFLGTGRWVKEVGLAYRLADTNLPRRTRISARCGDRRSASPLRGASPEEKCGLRRGP